MMNFFTRHFIFAVAGAGSSVGEGVGESETRERLKPSGENGALQVASS